MCIPAEMETEQLWYINSAINQGGGGQEPESNVLPPPNDIGG